MTTPNFMTWNNPGVALITGASSGIGAEFAKQLAAQGFNLILVARRRELLEKLASTLHSQHGITAEVIAADLSKRTDVEMFARKISTIDKLDILVNNAGFARMSPFAETDLQSQLDMIEVHNAAPTIFTRYVLPGMLKRNRGVIIFTSSMSAFLASPDFALYTATKAFLVGFAEVLKLELRDTNIRVQALTPGFTHTEFHDAPDLHEIKSSVPEFLFGSITNVVKESLKGARKRKVVVVPGLINRVVLLMPKRMMAYLV
jgi:short-subunit dehydrogenase